jgi:ribosomal protein S18 acetylase RimI-like enzyme
MKIIAEVNGFSVVRLNREYVEEHAEGIAKMLEQIKLVEYTAIKVLAESKRNREFLCKWQHSLVVLNQKKPIGVMIGYERAAEENHQYPKNSIYISELAVDAEYQQQGIGKDLLNCFLAFNRKIGFLFLQGDLGFTVQTNSASWNKHVVDLYRAAGFAAHAEKRYDDRTDLVLSKSK